MSSPLNSPVPAVRNMENEKYTNNIETSETNTESTNICDKETCHDANQKLSELNPNMSKRQLKKVKKREKWLERKDEKRLKEREKARRKRAFARANNIDLGPSRKALKRSTMADSSCKVGVTIDMSFDDLMIDKDIAKLTKQILRCYTLNRRAVAPMQFSLTRFDGKSRSHMQKHNGYEHWDGLCHKVAVQAGVRHGRLPLDKFLQMKARKVLTVDHVSEGRTWQEAFLQVLPERKNAQPIVSLEESKGTPNTCNKEEIVCHTNGIVDTKVKINDIENTDHICK
ncbi:tRNA methyltransferase 10 homolog A isoform X4 [Hylaeus volcanicus]|uniref:tRNA methyltransferase 10 homolog A isoform X4 n=1 Tax=Hylaeus volcanicus TaxID=313075 RepID=UPI0023B78035|nr:tRNA methyltransferase 10 homolog A isoform X4 [Hylaeus volcanicus]